MRHNGDQDFGIKQAACNLYYLLLFDVGKYYYLIKDLKDNLLLNARAKRAFPSMSKSLS